MNMIALMTTGAFSQNAGKLFSELKLVIDNLLFIYAEANWETTESNIYDLNGLAACLRTF